MAVLISACAPTASAPSASPVIVPSATAAPTTTATTTPTSTPLPTVAPGTPIPLPTGAEVAAASGGVVWMYVNGDHLFNSLNRGDTWTERPLPPGVRSGDIAFVSAGDGWFLQPSPPGSQCGSQDVVLWRTVNGATWSKLVANGIAQARCKGPVAFRDSSTGFIPVWDENAAPALYRTTDAGVTWTLTRPLPDPPGFTTRGAGVTLRIATIADFSSSLLVSALGFNSGSTYYAFRSTDGGASWSYVSTGPEQGMPIIFVTPTRWVQIVAPTASRETTDGGITWHTFASDYQQAAPIAPQIAFGDANTGYATVRGSIQRTIDGGAHWTQLKTPGT
jgi:photosystem II stability/assembly factor-like uncharacterized protein